MVRLPRVIGIVGGMTWEATALYYDRLNRLSNARLRLQQPDSAHTVRILIDSLDFGEIEKLANREDWPAIGRMLLASAQRLETAGAACVLLAANTAHLQADTVRAGISVPLIHVADALAAGAAAGKVRRVAILGTRFVARSTLFDEAFSARGMTAAPPDDTTVERVDRMIFDDLARGQFTPEVRAAARAVIEGLPAQGFDAAALCCTELPVLLRGESFALPVFDTVELHVRAALDFALEGIA
jgi:aspartate racemase